MTTRAPYYPIKTLHEMGNGYWRFDSHGCALHYPPETTPEEDDPLRFVGPDPSDDWVYSYYIRKEFKIAGEPVFCIYNEDAIGLTDRAASVAFLRDFESFEAALQWLHKNADTAVAEWTKQHKLDVARANQWHPELA